MNFEDAEALRRLPVQHDNLIGIDSDGCVFDSMVAKQCRCFHTAFIDEWQLQPIEAVVRETKEFANLYSASRGQDRFVTFDIAVDMLGRRPEVIASGLTLPDTVDLKRWLATGGPFGDANLQRAIEGEILPELADSESLQRLLTWSQEVNRRVRSMDPPPAFPEAIRFLQRVGEESDAIVVSSTPLSALRHDWSSAGLTETVRFIASKDIGTKVEHLKLALADEKYHPAHVLMIGDAPKDMQSAEKVGVRFYPICAGEENESWRHLNEHVYEKFLAGTYESELENALKKQFLRRLPATPNWKTI